MIISKIDQNDIYSKLTHILTPNPNKEYMLATGLKKKLQITALFWLTNIVATLMVGFVVIPNRLASQQSPTRVTSYPPSQYGFKDIPTSPQNFDICINKQGVVFVANNSAVLYFNGKNWAVVNGTENLRFTKLAMDNNGVVYSGGINELGKFIPDERGIYKFQSLKELLPDSLFPLPRLARVNACGNDIYFMGIPILLKFDGSEFSVLQDTAGFDRIFPFPQATYVTKKNGIWELMGEELKLVLSAEELPDSPIRGMHCIPNMDCRSIWVVFEDGAAGIFQRDSNIIEKDKNLFVRVTNSSLSESGKLILGTFQDGIFVLNSEGNVIGHYSKPELQDNCSYFPKALSKNSIWSPSNYGVDQIDFESPLSWYDRESGITSLVLEMNTSAKGMLLGAMDGIYLLPDPGDSVLAQAVQPRLIDNLEVWVIHSFEDFTLVSSLEGSYLLDKNLQKVSDLENAQLLGVVDSKDSPNTGYGIASQQLLRIRREGNQIHIDTLIPKLPHDVYSLIRKEDELWASYNGLSQVNIAGEIEITTFDSTMGLTEDMGIIETALVRDRVVFGTNIGIYTYDAAQQRLVPDTRFPDDFHNGDRFAYNLTETRKGDVWVTTNGQTGVLRLQPDSSYVYDSLPIIRAPVSDIFSIYEDPEGIMWFGGTEALVRYDPSIPKDYHLPYYVQISSVKVNVDSTIFYGNYADENGVTVVEQPESYVPTLTYDLNHLTFDYSALFYEARDRLQYSYQLVGQDEEWSKWSSVTTTEYTNLREGRYTFRVKARNVYGTISHIAEYSFRVLPPWYRTVWAYASYAVFAVLFFFVSGRLYSRRLIRQKKRLEGIVEQRTEEIRLEKEASDKLLLNILPRETAAELKEKGQAQSRRYEEVTVLFADVQGFTHIAENLSPEELVKELHVYFSKFDEITARHGVEKIKTIGDAYMAVGGLPVPNTTHAADVVRAALEMQEAMKELAQTRDGENLFHIRIGVHTGPVVAGIVGSRKFQYDIWGDTVNTAARMETSGEVGKVNISEVTYSLVKDEFECTFRGAIQAKNKGRINMYFVEGPKA